MLHPFDCIPTAEFESTRAAFDRLLTADGIAGVLVDVDGVLVRGDGSHPPPEVGENVDPAVQSRLAELHETHGACLVTNRIRYESFDPERLASVFGVPVVWDAPPKPSRKIFAAGLGAVGVSWGDREQAVMVGDSAFFDAYGAGRFDIPVYQVDRDRSDYPIHQMLGKRAAETVQTACKQLQAGLRQVPTAADGHHEADDC